MMLKLAILDDYLNSARSCADWSVLPHDVQLKVFERPFGGHEEAARELAGFEVIVAMRERTRFGPELLQRLPKLRLLVTTGMRNLAIDMDACRKQGVTVCGTRSASPPVAPTSELAWAHILALSKGYLDADRAVRAGDWQTGLAGSISGKSLGLVGLGKLGSQMAAIGLAFGMRVMAWSQNLDQGHARTLGVEPVTKSELFSQADFISLHVVLSRRTRHIVGEAELSLMKPGAYLINTARAGLVDQDALLTALRERRIAGAGIDVFSQEPAGRDDPLMGLSNVSLTPHLGYATRENFRIYYQDAVEDVLTWLQGKPIRQLN
ncbi:MAG: D-2-hydroxyacid dehydrogenase family protein [Desulfarculaceae bacterium]|jgi:phosphoglycerate dehydrogenase-like enzyme